MLRQRERLLILIIYLFVLALVSKIALGAWLPPASDKGLWFYAGIASVLLGNLIVTPYFTKPADALSYSVAAIIPMLGINALQHSGFSDFDVTIWVITIAFLLIVILSSIVSIVSKDAQQIFFQRLSKSLYLFCDLAGNPKAVFSAVFLFALLVFHRNSSREYFPIGVAWAFCVGLNPLEKAGELVRKLVGIWKINRIARVVGEVVGHQVPNIVLIRQTNDAVTRFGDVLLVRDENGRSGIALAVDHVGYVDGRWLRALHLPVNEATRSRLHDLEFEGRFLDNKVLSLNADDLVAVKFTSPIVGSKDKLIGVVAQETDISHLKIEIARTDIDLEDGRLVEVQVGSAKVLYQIINGLTKEEILQQKNTRGYVRAEAKKIGSWDEATQTFRSVNWIPLPNAPVFLVDKQNSTLARDVIGYFPGTTFPVKVHPHFLVTHNTAILGILGIGKSFLALELVERMIETGIKVICFDLTNQYATELAPYYDTVLANRETERLKALGPPGRTNVQQNVEEGGSVVGFATEVKNVLRTFLDPANRERRLKAFNPAQFEVWQQDSKPYQGKASMLSLTPTEITRIFSEAALEILQEQGMSDEAKCCLVYEEAHSLIPEWNAVASDGDKTATSGTARAILQGRKYGLGCLVVTQRTANVTKSILNQCNTVFALRVFDATGMEFLKNYIGEDYANVLSTLKERQAVLFGRGSSCVDPVLIQLNDRTEFVRVFRATTHPITREIATN